jgi:hypothetical protein
MDALRTLRLHSEPTLSILPVGFHSGVLVVLPTMGGINSGLHGWPKNLERKDSGQNLSLRFIMIQFFLSQNTCTAIRLHEPYFPQKACLIAEFLGRSGTQRFLPIESKITKRSKLYRSAVNSVLNEYRLINGSKRLTHNADSPCYPA